MITEKLLAKRLAGLNRNKILFELEKELYSFDRFLSGDLKVIGYNNLLHTDVKVKDVLSFSNWIKQKNLYPVVKVESIETQHTILRGCKWLKINSVHMFLNQKSGYSFNWHSDDVHVILLVLKGWKKVFIKNKITILKQGDFIFIPRGFRHKILSKKNTVALSFGF